MANQTSNFTGGTYGCRLCGCSEQLLLLWKP